MKKAIEETMPTPAEKAVKDQKEEKKKEEDLECELHLSPMDVDKVLVNGVELTKEFTLATLRAACSFLGNSIATRRWNCSAPKFGKCSKRLGRSLEKL